MKVAKKVLAIVMALALIISSFAICASAAEGDHAATNSFTWTVKAEASTVTYGTKNKVTINRGGSERTGVITVNPGDTFMINVYADSDYFVQAWATGLFYDAGLLDCIEMAEAQTGKDFTSTQVSNSIVYNEAAGWGKAVGHSLLSKNIGDAMVPSSRADINKWPTEPTDDHTLLAGVTMDGFGFYQVGNTAFVDMIEDPDGFIPLFSSADGWVFSVPVQVPADAAAGTEYFVGMFPEQFKHTTNKRLGTPFAAELGADEDGDNVGYVDQTACLNVDNFACDNFVCNNVTLKVAGAAVTLDYTALETLYNSVSTTDITNATAETKAPFEAALAAASALLQARNAADQDAITAATTALQNAYDALEFPAAAADYTGLDAVIADADLLVQADYTAASWAPFAAALAAAKAVDRDLTVDDQDDIEDAKQALIDAMAALKTPADYSALNDAISLAESKTEFWFTPDSWAAMVTAYNAAKAVPAGLSYEDDQNTITTAATALNNAIAGLVEADADYTALNAAKAQANAKVAADYTAESFADLTTAIALANAVPANLKAKDQGRIDYATDALETAMNCLVPLGGADYTALNAEIAAGTEYTQDKYTAASWAVYADALAAAQNLDRNLKSTSQPLVDDALDALQTAKAALELKPADYTAVDQAIANIPEDLSLYTDDSAAAVIAAKNAVVRGKNILEQDTVTGYAAAINEKIDALEYKPANTTPLDNAIAAAANYAAANYTAASYADLTAAVEAGRALLAGDLDIRNNAAIVEAAGAIQDAIDNLDPLGADYSALNAAKAAYGELVEANYTTDSWAAVATAYATAAAIPDGLAITEQDRISGAAQALNDAINALVEADADYSAVDAAMVGVPASQMGGSGANVYKKYTDESWNALQNAIAAVQPGMKKKDQATVDGWAEAITAAKVLIWEPFDFTATQAIVDQVDGLNPLDYTTASWNALQTVISGLTMSGTNEKYGQLHYQEMNLTNKYNQLVPAPEANYGAVYNAQAEANALDEADYTADSWAGLQTALGAVVFGLNENYQDEVDAMADAIMTAINNLVEIPHPADYSGLEAALRAAEALNEEDWTAATWAVLADAVTAGYGIEAGLTVDDQDEIDAAEVAIRNAIAALEEYVAPEEDADYTAYNAALAQAAALNSADYTAESWNALQQALSDNRVADGLKESSQGVIDEATANILAAIGALEDYVAPVYTSKVRSVTYEPSADTHKTFVVTIEGRPTMVQFITPGGTTATFDRYNEKVLSLVSYTSDGQECDSLDRNVAYEVWTIYTNTIANGDLRVRGKYTSKSLRAYWEADKDAEGLYTFHVSTLGAEKGSVYAVEYDPNSAVYGKYATFTVETDKTVAGIYMKMPSGATATFKADKYAKELSNGHLLYTCRAKISYHGENVITLKTVNAQNKTAAFDNNTMTFVAE